MAMPCSLGFFRGQADVGEFGRGVGTPGNCESAEFGSAKEKCIPDYDSRHEIRRVSELKSRTHIARGEDS